MNRDVLSGGVQTSPSLMNSYLEEEMKRREVGNRTSRSLQYMPPEALSSKVSLHFETLDDHGISIQREGNPSSKDQVMNDSSLQDQEELEEQPSKILSKKRRVVDDEELYEENS